MKKWAITSIIFAFSLFITSASSVAKKVELGLAGSGTASLAYTLVAGFAENTNTKTNLVRITPETSAGYVENIRLLGRGETELALFGGLHAYQGLRGIGAYKGEPPYKDIRGVAVVYVGNVSWCAKKGITKVTELAGKRVNLGPPGSNIAYLGELILKVYGVRDKVSKLGRLSYGEAARAYADGEIDAFMGGPAPYPAVMQAAARREMNILPVDVEHVKKVQEIAPVIADTIPASAYDWLKEDVVAVGYLTYLGAHKKVPADAIYEILRVNLTPEGIKYLKNNHRLWSMWENKMYIEEKGAFILEELKLHPGAVKYWKEQGVKIPASILPE
jgi:TRAP transporter TAXI family solute receptor